MATRQNQDNQPTSESTEQTDLFEIVENTPTKTTPDDPDNEPGSLPKDSWQKPFNPHSNTNLDVLTDSQALSEAREIAHRYGDGKAEEKLQTALQCATTGECVKRVRELIGLNGSLRGTHMFDENLEETAQKVLGRLRSTT